MSGAVTATAIGLGISAAATIGSTVMGVKQAHAQEAMQKKQLQQQKTAQSQAEAQAVSNQRKSELAQNAANMKTPDIAAILGRAASSANSGIGSTMLTGPTGIDAGSLPLGGSTLLGK